MKQGRPPLAFPVAVTLLDAAREARMRSQMAAPCIGVTEALAAIRRRDILLSIGQELAAHFDEALEFIRADLELSRGNPRLLFGYTGMDWRKKDRPAIRELHWRADACWPHLPRGAA